MRTAEAILSKIKSESIWGDMGDEYAEDDVIKAINEARIEAIKECAERVQQNYNLTIDRQSILSLIEEVK